MHQTRREHPTGRSHLSRRHRYDATGSSAKELKVDFCKRITRTLIYVGQGSGDDALHPRRLDERLISTKPMKAPAHERGGDIGHGSVTAPGKGQHQPLLITMHTPRADISLQPGHIQTPVRYLANGAVETLWQIEQDSAAKRAPDPQQQAGDPA